jgi:hypothetical protein
VNQSNPSDSHTNAHTNHAAQSQQQPNEAAMASNQYDGTQQQQPQSQQPQAQAQHQQQLSESIFGSSASSAMYDALLLPDPEPDTELSRYIESNRLPVERAGANADEQADPFSPRFFDDDDAPISGAAASAGASNPPLTSSVGAPSNDTTQTHMRDSLSIAADGASIGTSAAGRTCTPDPLIHQAASRSTLLGKRNRNQQGEDEQEEQVTEERPRQRARHDPSTLEELPISLCNQHQQAVAAAAAAAAAVAPAAPPSGAPSTYSWPASVV